MTGSAPTCFSASAIAPAPPRVVGRRALSLGAGQSAGIPPRRYGLPLSSVQFRPPWSRCRSLSRFPTDHLLRFRGSMSATARRSLSSAMSSRTGPVTGEAKEPDLLDYTREMAALRASDISAPRSPPRGGDRLSAVSRRRGFGHGQVGGASSGVPWHLRGGPGEGDIRALGDGTRAGSRVQRLDGLGLASRVRLNE